MGPVAEYKKSLNVPSVLNTIQAPSATPPLSTRIQLFKHGKGLIRKSTPSHKSKKFNAGKLNTEKQGKDVEINDNVVPKHLETDDTIVTDASGKTSSESFEHRYTKVKRKFLKHKKEQVDSQQSDSPFADYEGSSQPSRNDSDSGIVRDSKRHSEFSLHERLERYMAPGLSSTVVENQDIHDLYRKSATQDNSKQTFKNKTKQKSLDRQNKHVSSDFEQSVFVHHEVKPITAVNSLESKKHSTPILPASPRKYIAPDDSIDVENGTNVSRLHEVPNTQNKTDTKLEYEREITDINFLLKDDELDDDLLIERIVSIQPKNTGSTNLNYQPSINLPGRPQRIDSIRTLPSSTIEIDEGKASTKETRAFSFHKQESGAKKLESKAAKATESLNEAIEIVLDIGNYISPIQNSTDDVTLDGFLSTTGVLSLEPEQSAPRSRNIELNNELRLDIDNAEEADLSSITYSESQASRKKSKKMRKRKHAKDSSSGESEKYFDSGSSFYSGRVSRDTIQDDLIRHVRSRESYC